MDFARRLGQSKCFCDCKNSKFWKRDFQDGGKIFEGKISDEVIDILIKNNYAENPRQVRNKLAEEKIIDDYDIIIDSKKLQDLLPNQGIQKDKIRNNPKKSAEKVKLRKENWEKIKELWIKISSRYMIKFNKLTDEEILNIAKEAVGGNLKSHKISNQKESLVSSGNKVEIKSSTSSSEYKFESIKYGSFLEKLSQKTNISLKIWHEAILSKKIPFDKDCFNSISLQNIIDNFHENFEKTFSKRYCYNSLDFTANTSLIHNGEWVDEISKTLLGKFSSDEIEVNERNLWDEICYDSIEPEMKISKINPDGKVIVFGKIPQRAIRIPLFNGGTTSPDFIYTIRKENGIEVNLFIEAKSENLKGSEHIAIDGQKMFYKNIDNIQWKKVTSAQEVESIIQELEK